jgi:hypothetical protein
MASLFCIVWAFMDWPPYFRILPLAVALAVGLGIGKVARGDVFYLTSGGRIEGEWINSDQQPATEYLVRTVSGLTTSLGITQVREIARQTPFDVEHARRAAVTADTVPAQWELAEWCREQGLIDHRKIHLLRIIELDPNHQQARYALGYQFLEGEWTTRDEFRRQKGFELYRGKWRTPQEIEILEERARKEIAQKDWLQKLRRWRRDLDDPERARSAYQSLLAIQDPLAVDPLASMLASERVRRVKQVYADVLAQMNCDEAVGVLVHRVLVDPDEEMLHYCLERLLDRHPPRLADRFITALRDPANSTVNRAAYALGQIGDTSALAPLIAALVTTHQQVLPGRGSPDSTTATFSESGPSVQQGQGPQIVIRHIRNQHVLDALVRLTGTNFDFDKNRWQYWIAQEQRASEAAHGVADARRQ